MDISAIDSNFAGAKAEGGYRWYDVTAAPQIRVFGVTFDKREGRFLRLPREAAAATSAGVNTLASCTAGGRVRFDANSDKIAIRAEINTVIAASHLSGLCSAGARSVPTTRLSLPTAACATSRKSLCRPSLWTGRARALRSTCPSTAA